jgi:hypothetical protein
VPKEIPGIPTEVLLRELSQLDGMLLVTPQQAAIILSRTPKQLSDDRAAGRPPPFTKVGGSNRYSIQAIREYVRGNTFKSTAQASSHERKLTSGLVSASFSAFMNEGHDSLWPFMVEAGKPLEFFYSLTQNLSEDAAGEWLTLPQYLAARQRHLDAERASEQDATIKADMAHKDLPTGEGRPVL